MPTTLPVRPAPERRLSWPQAVRLFVLLARVRWLDMRAHALVGRGAGFSDGRLLRLRRRWLACHEAIAALPLDIPEPKHFAEVRAILQLSHDLRECHAATRPQS